MRDWQLAQFNVARMRYAPDDERVSEFFARIEEINALADQADGFVWRLQDDVCEAPVPEVEAGIDPFEITNISVWDSIESLFDYVYRTSHKELIAKRKDWFERPSKAIQVLWWVPAGDYPTVAEGQEKLRLLNEHGPSADYFSFKARFPSPGNA